MKSEKEKTIEAVIFIAFFAIFCLIANIISYNEGFSTVNEYIEKDPIGVSYMFLFSIILSVLLSLVLPYFILVVTKRIKNNLRLKRNVSEMQKKIQEQENELKRANFVKKELRQIPNFLNYLRKFLFNFLKDRDKRKDQPNIQDIKVDEYVREIIEKNSNKFLVAMETLGFKGLAEKKTLIEDVMFDESKDFRLDLKSSIKREIELKKKEEQLKVQKQKTKEAFGEEIIDPNLVEIIDSLKTIDEKIDELLKSYENWDGQGEKKE